MTKAAENFQKIHWQYLLPLLNMLCMVASFRDCLLQVMCTACCTRTILVLCRVSINERYPSTIVWQQMWWLLTSLRIFSTNHQLVYFETKFWWPTFTIRKAYTYLDFVRKKLTFVPIIDGNLRPGNLILRPENECSASNYSNILVSTLPIFPLLPLPDLNSTSAECHNPFIC